MSRRIWIIPRSMKVDDALEDAKAAHCPEVVSGIPPRLEGVIEEASLPMAFEEPEPPPEPETRDLAAELDALKIRVKKLEE